jgi:uncharacterized OsmC-like protein
VRGRLARRASSASTFVPLLLLDLFEELTMTTTQTRAIDNGVNVAALLGAREALAAQPPAARFQWRASSEWLHGTHNRATIESFHGLGAEQKHRRAYSYETDHPEVFAAADNGATPVEMVLVGLAGCLTAGVAAVAQNRQIALHSVKATLEADMDLRGILGIGDQTRNGFEAIRVHYEIDADATQAEIEALVAQSQKRSAVFDIVSNPTDVAVTARKRA